MNIIRPTINPTPNQLTNPQSPHKTTKLTTLNSIQRRRKRITRPTRRTPHQDPSLQHPSAQSKPPHFQLLPQTLQLRILIQPGQLPESRPPAGRLDAGLAGVVAQLRDEVQVFRGKGGEATDTDVWVCEVECCVGVEDARTFGAELVVDLEDGVFHGAVGEVEDLSFACLGREEGVVDSVAEFGWEI